MRPCNFLVMRPFARRFCAPTAPRRIGSPLLQPPASGKGPIELVATNCLDLDLVGIPTISVIGPSRRGKSVLASLLGGGTDIFAQSHSSFQAMTSGTHIVEVEPWPGSSLRLIDTEGLSHIGRSRNSEALVRQLLISTYLTSSCVIWLDTEVLSSSFFTMMWLVYDYVVDVLRVKHAAGNRLPRLMYVRTQETDVQKREYTKEFGDFGTFFAKVLETHEDAPILEQMFAPGGIGGQSLPVWTVEDLENYEAGCFWSEDHTSVFKTAVTTLRDELTPRTPPSQGSEAPGEGPPLLALSSLEGFLPKISKLEAFDPRDHEVTKITRLRNQLRSAYGRLGSRPDDVLRLANQFDPADKDVRRHQGRIQAVVQARLEDICGKLRLEPELAAAEPEVKRLLALSERAADVFSIGFEAFAKENYSERGILGASIERWGLDADEADKALKADLAQSQLRFLDEAGAATGLDASSMKRFRLYEQAVWRVDDCVMRLRARAVAELHLRKPGVDSDTVASVWRLGEWQGAAPSDGKTTSKKPQEFALWTDGSSWELYLESKEAPHAGGKWVGLFRKSGVVDLKARALPVPLSSPLSSGQSSVSAGSAVAGSAVETLDGGALGGGAL